MPGLALVGYDLDLNKAAGGELGYLEAGTAGKFRAEVIPVDPVHGREVVEIDQEYGGFEDVLHGSSRGLENVVYIDKSLMGLSLNAFRELACSGIYAQLAGGEYKAVGFAGMAVGAEGGGGAIAFDDVFMGVLLLIYVLCNEK